MSTESVSANTIDGIDVALLQVIRFLAWHFEFYCAKASVPREKDIGNPTLLHGAPVYLDGIAATRLQTQPLQHLVLDWGLAHGSLIFGCGS